MTNTSIAFRATAQPGLTWSTKVAPTRGEVTGTFLGSEMLVIDDGHDPAVAI